MSTSMSATEGRPVLLSTRVQLVMYSLLLVVTPFCMLQGFLQEAVGMLSRLEVELGGHQVPVIPVVGGMVLLALVLALIRRLTAPRLLGVLIALGLVLLGHQIADYYFDHRYYDIQHNWHYGAYAGFAFMVYRDLASRGHSLARIMLTAYLLALGFSTFDESFQLFMAARVFDIGDIAKDAWGCLVGLVLVAFWGPHLRQLRAPQPLLHPRLIDDLRHPRSLFLLLLTFSFILLAVSSNLTDVRNWTVCVGGTLAAFFVALLLLRLLAHRRSRRVVLGFLLGCLLVLVWARWQFREPAIPYARYGLTVYQGIPIPLFDLLVRPDGSWRIVDKKHAFGTRDLRCLLRQGPDVILFGTGYSGSGGKGLPGAGPSRFIYNTTLHRGTQLILLDTPQAVQEYNRLRARGAHVLLVLHTTG